MQSILRFLLALTLTFAITSPAAAQPGGPCTFIADSTVAPAHAFQAFKIPSVESCAVDDGVSNPISILHISGALDPDDVNVPGAASAAAPPIETTPIDGLGDSAKVLRFMLDEGVLVSLRVQRGSEVFAFNTEDAPDAQSRLTALATTVLAP
jgi:hypothetical protein